MSEGRAKVKVAGLRLSETELAAITRARQTHTGVEKRKQRRLALPETFTLLVRLEQASGPAVFTVVPRDLSAEGVGFFHTSYVHPGTHATFLMRSRTGDSVGIPGAVKWCQHVGGRVHEVGAVFEQAVRVEVFVEAPAESAGKEGDAGEPAIAAAEALCDRIGALADELKGLAHSRAALEEIGAKVAQLVAAVSPAAGAVDGRSR